MRELSESTRTVFLALANQGEIEANGYSLEYDKKILLSMNATTFIELKKYILSIRRETAEHYLLKKEGNPSLRFVTEVNFALNLRGKEVLDTKIGKPKQLFNNYSYKAPLKLYLSFDEAYDDYQRDLRKYYAECEKQIEELSLLKQKIGKALL